MSEGGLPGSTLGELARSGVLEIGDGYRTKSSELSSEGFAIIRVADVNGGRVEVGGSERVSFGRSQQIGLKEARAGDVLLTTKGTVGRVAVMPAVAERAVYSPQLCYFRIRDDDRVDPGFLRYWLNSAEFFGQASYLQGNTDMAPYISLTDLRAVRIALPPITEQRAIAEVLGALDDKIAANQRLVEAADRLAAATVEQYLLSSRRVALRDVAAITSGTSPSGESLNELGEGIPFFQGVRDFGFRSPRLRVSTTSPIRLAKKGDVLVSVRAPVGSVNVAPSALCIGRGLAAIRGEGVAQSVLFHVLRSPGLWGVFEGGGTVFGSISSKELSALEIPWPSEPERAEQSVAPIEAQIVERVEQNRLLASTRDALLPALMSGRLTVRDAERVVADAT